MVLVFALILFGFLLGVLVILLAEAFGFLWILKQMRRKITSDQSKISSIAQLGTAQFDPTQHLFKKEGVVWVLDPDKVSKYWLDRSSRELKRKKEILEVSPARKYGKINGESLVLTETDGLQTTIELKGCLVEAVSAINTATKKWAKKYPIKVESKTSMIYHGSKTLYLYLETSSEKEAWCKALRLASCDQREQLEWFAQLQEEFHSYLTSLNTEYHSIMKPSVGTSGEAIERTNKSEGGSKVRHFLKKLAKKTSLSHREERKKPEKLRACQEAVLATGLMKSASTTSHLKSSMLDDAPLSSASLSHSDSQSHFSVCSDTDDKFGMDDGTLCWNLLVSRLFFDVKGNEHMKRSVKERIQRTLSNVRTPTYVGEVICTDINLGNVPPCIHGMRVLPMEMSEVCALEVDIEYSGSAVLEIETRLEVREVELHQEKESSNPETRNVGAVQSDLLNDFEYLDKQLNLEGMNDLQGPKENDLQGPKEAGDWNIDVSKSFKNNNTSSAAHGSRWKSMIHSVVKQVSQVPISLAIRVASLRGTLRLLIKPPPSDQLWYGFTFMPDIDFNLASSVGEHKITNTHIALFLINRLKAAIRDTLVLPNSESVSISWMLAEKDDWVPRNVAPFIWINQDSVSETSTSIDINNQPSCGLRSSTMNSESRSSTMNSESRSSTMSRESSHEPARKSDSVTVPLSSYSSTILRNSKSLEELAKPLLENDQPQETSDLKELSTPLLLTSNSTHETGEEKIEDVSNYKSPTISLVMDKPSSSIEQPKKFGKRERMLDFRRKMSGKFEEKKRHIVEKMRGP